MATAFDDDGIVFLLAAIARKALSDQATPAVGPACRIEAAAFLDQQYPEWRKWWVPTQRANRHNFPQGARHEKDACRSFD